MKGLFIIAIFCLSACGPLEVNINRAAVAAQVTHDPAEQAYLAGLRVDYIAGSPLCDGVDDPRKVILGCFYPADQRIEVATIDFSRFGGCAFRYDSDMANTLAHEYRHALQLYRHLPVTHPLPAMP